MRIYEMLDKFGKHFNPAIINLISVWIAFNFQFYKDFLGEQNSLALNSALYSLILTGAKNLICGLISDNTVNIIADLSLKKNDNSGLTQQIKLTQNIPKNIWLRIEFIGNRDKLIDKNIRIEFPSGVTASCCTVKGIINFNNKENILLIPLHDICTNDKYYMEIQLIQSVLSAGEKTVTCSVYKPSKLVNISTNKMLVSVG